MTKNILVGTIEGRLTYLNQEASLEVKGNPEDIEYISTWLDDNLPAAGQYVRIEVMVFPGA